MNVTDVMSMITTVGFPIVCCLGLGVFMVKLIEKIFSMFTVMNTEMRDDFSKQIETLKESLDNLTKVVEKTLEEKR